MGCTSEKSIPVDILNKRQKLLTDENIMLDLHDIEKQGESKHPQKEFNDEEIQDEKNYYNYNLNDLVLINNTKMTVKRIENFEDDDEDDESDDDNDSNKLENIEEEKKEEENIDDKISNDNKEDRIVQKREEVNNINNIYKLEDENDKKPEDKKPPNIEKLRKKGIEKQEINFF